MYLMQSINMLDSYTYNLVIPNHSSSGVGFILIALNMACYVDDKMVMMPIDIITSQICDLSGLSEPTVLD